MKSRIIYFLAIAVITMFVKFSISQTLFTENFSYPPINSIVGLNGWVQAYAPNPNNTIPVLNTGSYFYRLSADGFTDVKKMILVK